MRLRSVLAIPAGTPVGREQLESSADAILLTLADARVPVGRLRHLALEALPAIASAGKLALVRVNHPRTGLLRDDLDALTGPHLDAVLVNHTVEPQDLRDTAVLLREFELGRGVEPGRVRVFPVIDTARALLRAADILQAVARCAGLVFDPAGYAWDVGAREEELGPRLAYARGQAVAAARAFGLLPLVAASPFQLRFLAQSGFAGAILTDPTMVSVANEVFGTNQFARRRAEAELQAYEAARAEGAAVARYGERVIDAEAARRLRQRLES
ncbi:(3S)-malyl-CoA thioesterase [bacterium HR29]|jgi:citrate lyase subunit beta/citryl-CoA lyase|nr:(3S)-malyl-CoA thioesterase [bacterium HR29]